MVPATRAPLYGESKVILRTSAKASPLRREAGDLETTVSSLAGTNQDLLLGLGGLQLAAKLALISKGGPDSVEGPPAPVPASAPCGQGSRLLLELTLSSAPPCAPHCLTLSSAAPLAFPLCHTQLPLIGVVCSPLRPSQVYI